MTEIQKLKAELEKLKAENERLTNKVQSQHDYMAPKYDAAMAEIEKLKAERDTMREELSEYRSSTAYSDLYHEAQGLTAERDSLKAKLAKAEEVKPLIRRLEMLYMDGLGNRGGGFRDSCDNGRWFESYDLSETIKGLKSWLAAAQFTKGEENG